MRSQFIRLAVEVSLSFAIRSFEGLFPVAVLELWIAQARKAIEESHKNLLTIPNP